MPIPSSTTTFAPEKGRLIPLRTVAETQSRLRLIDCHILELPIKSSNVALDIIRRNTDQDAIDLHHTRRFVRPDFLPCSLRERFEHAAALFEEYASDKTVPVLETEESVRKRTLSSTANDLHYLLVCASRLISSSALFDLFASNPSFKRFGRLPVIVTAPVPLLPPASQEEALSWSRDYWPSLYQKNNTYGALPSLIESYATNIQPHVPKWMSMARAVADEVRDADFGESFGVVIVDKNGPNGPLAIAAAGDARKCGAEGSHAAEYETGNVLTHSTMRAIGMVARKRRTAITTTDDDQDAASNFLTHPLTQLEMTVYNATPLQSHGYLCVDLEIYLTHEPCVMCAMAILHSRFSAVVFAQRMSATGAFAAESKAFVRETGQEATGDEGLGLGLFWRPELNWKMMAWEWDDGDGRERVSCAKVHV